jgi:hypothetical protein
MVFIAERVVLLHKIVKFVDIRIYLFEKLIFDLAADAHGYPFFVSSGMPLRCKKYTCEKCKKKAPRRRLQRIEEREKGHKICPVPPQRSEKAVGPR